MDAKMLNEISKGMYDLVVNHAVQSGIVKIEDGMVVYSPINSIDEYTSILMNNPGMLGYNTHSMGRGIFIVTDDGSIINYKGVDSHLSDEENYAILLTKKGEEFGKTAEFYSVTDMPSYGVFLMKDRLCTEFRIRGASELQNLINEKDKINKLKEMDKDEVMKLEILGEIYPMSDEFVKKYHLPLRVPMTFDYLESVRNSSNTYTSYCIDYMNRVGMDTSYRYELMSEYFTPELLSEKNIEITPELQLAIDNHDSLYQLGGAFGQMERKLDSPFRILDLEFLVNKKDKSDKDIKKIEAILSYLENKNPDFFMDFVLTTASNLAGLYNYEISYHNYMHRQDFSLTGELCDDAFDSVSNYLESLNDENITDEMKMKANYEKLRYLFQFYYLGSNIKVLEDAFKLTGREIQQDYMNVFFDSFLGNLKGNEHISREQLLREIYGFHQYDIVVGGKYSDLFEPYKEYMGHMRDGLGVAIEKSRHPAL